MLNKVDFLCDAGCLPMEDKSFQTVFSTQVIEHVPDHNKLLKEASRVLESGGHIIISGPMYWHLHEEPHDYFRFTKYGFMHLLDVHGFEEVEILSNGGKWATFGQMIIHTFPKRLIQRRFIRRVINVIFSRLDEKYYDDYNTMNYVVVGRKK